MPGPREWSPRRALILATIEDAASVILNGVTIYHDEENDRDHINMNFSAEEVADRLAQATKMVPIRVKLVRGKDVPDDWNFDDVERAAIIKADRK